MLKNGWSEVIDSINLDGCHSGNRLGNRPENNFFYFRQTFTPVIGIGDKGVMVALYPFLEHERPGSNRIFLKAFDPHLFLLLI